MRRLSAGVADSAHVSPQVCLFSCCVGFSCAGGIGVVCSSPLGGILPNAAEASVEVSGWGDDHEKMKVYASGGI